MQVNKNTVSQFLTANYMCFMIPVYQRNYDWSTENCKQLWNDIWYVASASGTTTHFLGTICSKTVNGHEKTIIDGQQRITTITLLMKAMHDSVDSKDFRSDIDATYLHNTGYGVRGDQRVKLHLNRRDDAIYNRLLVNADFMQADQLSSQEAASSIYRNYAYFHERLQGLSEQEIVAVRDALDRLVIVDLDVEGENPQEIFESLNSTGLDLTDVDLLRNYLLMSLDHKTQVHYYEDYWYKIEENVRPQNMVRFFIDYLIYTKKSDAITLRGRRAHVNEHNLYPAFKDYCRALAGEQERYSGSPEVTKELLESMLACSKVYRDLVFEEGADVKEMGALERSIYSTVYLNQSPACRPVLLYVMTKLHEGRISEGEAQQMLDACLSLVFRAKVSGKTGINGQFAGNVLQRLPEDDLGNVVDDFWRALTSGSGRYAFPDDQTFEESLTSRPIFEVLRAKGTKYLLYTLELSSQAAKGLPSYGDRNTTIEHIMPTTMSEDWEKALGDDATLHDDYLNRLGNLALTSNNPEMSNAAFVEKAHWYKESSFSHTRCLADRDEWGIDAIRERTESLAKKCVQIWYMPEEYQDKSPASCKTPPSRRPPFSFDMIGLVPGDVVTFIPDPSRTAVVVDNKTVSYEGKNYSLSKLAAKLYGNEDGAYQGPIHFSYDGQSLDEIRLEFEGGIYQ